MKSDSDEVKKLTLLGFCAGNSPLVMDIAKDAMHITEVDIVKNVTVDVPDNLSKRFGIKVNDGFSDSYEFLNPMHIHFGVLDAHLKYAVFNHFQKKYNIGKVFYSSIIHPKSFIASSVKQGNGLLLEPMAVISSESAVGFGVTIKRNSSIGHHVSLGDFSTINPGAILSGNVNVGEGATIGSGATIIHNIKVGKYSLIGAGSVVTKNIPDGVVAFGNPCRVVRKYDRWENVLRDHFKGD